MYKRKSEKGCLSLKIAILRLREELSESVYQISVQTERVYLWGGMYKRESVTVVLIHTQPRMHTGINYAYIQKYTHSHIQIFMCKYTTVSLQCTNYAYIQKCTHSHIQIFTNIHVQIHDSERQERERYERERVSSIMGGVSRPASSYNKEQSDDPR